MMVLFGFNVHTPQGVQESPRFFAGDMCRLEEMFPTNAIWSGKSKTCNVYSITLVEAKALYDEMAAYYAKATVSDEPYQGNHLGPFTVMSDMQSTFDEFIAFCEEKLGFTCPAEAKAAITAKQDERKTRHETAAKNYATDVVAFFKTLGTLGPPPTPVIRTRLEAKLVEYRTRLAEDRRWYCKHPQLVFLTEKGYRDTTYKIVVAEAILTVAAPVSLEVLAKAQLEHSEAPFDIEEFFMACAVIAAYLETPIAEGELLKRENGEVHIVAL